jgi:4-hydroxybenzoate polyprenyltransferase
MRTPIGKVSKLSLLLLAAVAGAIVAGLLMPGNTGTVIQAVGWLALAGIIIMEVGFLIVPKHDYEGDDRRPRTPPRPPPL